NGAAHVRPDAVPVHHAQQDRDGARAAAGRGHDAGAWRLADRRRRPRRRRTLRGGGMSSLGISLLLLLVVAIVVAIGYNLRQGAWPRWEQAFRRLAGNVRARATSERVEALRRKESSASNGRRSAERGEPRLGAGSVPPRTDADADVAFDPAPPAGGSAVDLDTAPVEREDAEPAPARAREMHAFDAREDAPAANEDAE